MQGHRNTLANLSKRTEVRSASFGHWLLGICCCLLVWSGGYSIRAHAEETTAGGLRFHAEKIVAVTDIHGAYSSLAQFLQETHLLDEDLDWIGESTHFVVTGDMLDRGPDSRKVMDLLMRLEGQALAAGGRVHVLIGNHEVMNLSGDLRYVSNEEFAAFATTEDPAVRDAARVRFLMSKMAERDGRERTREMFKERYPPGFFGHLQAFSPTGRYGSWLLSKAVLVIINDTAFVHAGLSAGIVGADLATINADRLADLSAYSEAWHRLVNDGLVDPDPTSGGVVDLPEDYLSDDTLDPDVAASVRRAIEGADAGLSSPDSLVWYRGTASCNPLLEIDVVESVLDDLGASRVVVGHTPTWTRRVISRLDGRAILIDTGMLTARYAGQPSALIIEGDHIGVRYAGLAELSEPITEERRVGSRPSELDASRLTDLLATAEIVDQTRLRDGSKDSQLITLAAGETEIQAVFNPVDTSRGRKKRQAKSDSFYHDIAAYRLDRLLDARLVPVTVFRTIDGVAGSLQFLPSGSVTEAERQEQRLGGGALCDLNRQLSLMYVFDTLIHNEYRRPTNLIYARGTWEMMLTGHSQAFRTKQRKPDYLTDTVVTLTPEFATRLAALTRTELQAELGEFLAEEQIEALDERREALLADIGDDG